MDIYSLGLNWWLTRWAQVGVNYRYIFLYRIGTEGDSSGLKRAAPGDVGLRLEEGTDA